MDKIFESILRLGLNTVIPCSFIDILNPAEEAIVAQAAKRGLYISQHHQEPVGVAYFAAENYMLEHYPDKAVSFVASPDKMTEIWRVYIDKWSKYEPQVIWQLGLRGKGDKAVWHTDESVDSSAEKRGAVISSAVETQHRLIAEAVGHTDFLSTSTLWLEGAELYDQGYLKFPKNTITVFSDIGDTQLFGGDFYDTKRRNGEKYGIYYHAGFFVEGPHYAVGTDPRKMVFCYRDAEKYHSLYFSILNVANVREMCASIRLNAAILQGSPKEFDLDQYYKETYTRLFGEAGLEVAELGSRYFSAIGDMGDALGREIVSLTDFHYHSIPNLPFPYYPLTDGALFRMTAGILGAWRRPIGTWKVYTENEVGHARLYKEVCHSITKLEALIQDMDAVEGKIKKNALYHYNFSLRFQTEIMLRICRWARCACEMYDGKNVEENRALAVQNLEEILALRKPFNCGKWQGWYDCDIRLNTRKRINETLAFVCENKGE